MRLHVPLPLVAEAELTLPPDATRHAQVRRVQPGDTLLLFDGGGCDWPATVLAVTRGAVSVRVGAPTTVDRELPVSVTLAVGMPANDRMDALIEKAVELGVARIQPLLTERSVLRLTGERAERKRVHWQAIAASACEQCGRARVPPVAPVQALGGWLATLGPAADRESRLLLSLAGSARPLQSVEGLATTARVVTLSGPEGGLTDSECSHAEAKGFVATGLGSRVLRADTAPLALLAWIGLRG